MGSTAIPYSRNERRKGYFIIHLDEIVPKKLPLKERLKFWKKQQSTELKRQYCIFNKDKTKYTLIEDMKKAHIFRFDSAVELARSTKNNQLKVSMVRKAGNEYILV